MQRILSWLKAKAFTVFLVVVGLFALFYLGQKTVFKPQAKTQYQTASVEKGTLIVSISTSGQISSANSASVSTQTSGVVNKIYVENGQKVNTGDPIAEVDLDMDGRQRAAQAQSGYLSAKNSFESAQISLYTLQSDMITKWDTFKSLAENSTYQNTDKSPNASNRQLPAFITTDDNWLAAEAKYKLQQNVIAQSQIALSSAWASYQQASPIIYAPISGTISGLSLQVGSVLTAQTSSSGNSASQRIANIRTDATPIVTVSLTEIDVPKVQIENQATLTLDALPGKSYTGKIVSIDSTGSVSSGVTSYVAYIKLDTDSEEIFPNMAAQAKIITQVKDNVLLVPSSAVQTQNGEVYVRVLQKGKVNEVNIETGLSSSTQTEITSGLSEGDSVVTNILQNTTTSSQNSSQSPFSGFGGGSFREIGR